MHVLPDVLAQDLKLVICGTAAGKLSAALGAYYARPTNTFWQVLFDVRLTSVRLQPNDYRDLLNHGIGLTDLAKAASGTDIQVGAAEYDITAFVRKIDEFQPRIVAFNGAESAKAVFRQLHGLRDLPWGRQDELVGGSVAFVVPSTSGSNNGLQAERNRQWNNLAKSVRALG